MPRFAANLAMLFTEAPFLDRFELAAQAATIQKHLPLIRHIQLADNPGRNEPGTGEISYPFLFALPDRLGCAGWIGCEYKPAAATEAGLERRRRLAQ